ncbi:MAG: PEGA domain-containing protein [Pseudomonadota bacterium]
MRKAILVERLSALAGALVLGGCVTSGGNGTLITSTPSAANVSAPGFTDCETPCRMTLSSTTRITVAKAGYTPQRFDVKPGKRKVAVTLELAAPTEDVDESALPDL